MIEGFNQAINTARAQGIDLDQWIESIGPNMGVVITASREENAVIPLPTGAALEVPQAAVALVFEVHDDAIFTYLDNMTQQMPNVLRMGFDDVTMRSIQIPVPVPIRVQPTYAKMGKYLVLASNGEILKAMNACAKGRTPSIETDEEFLKLSADMPTEGLGFSFLSQRFGQIMTGITQSAMAADPGGLEMSRLFNTMEGQAAYSVTVRMPDALVGVSRSTYNVGETVVIQCAAIPVVMAGMLLPAMTQARGKARNISDMGNLKQIALGVIMYQADHNDMLPNDLGDIWDYVGDGRVFVSPAGNTQPPTSADEIRAGKCDYLYFTKGKKLTEVKNPSQTPMACTKPGMLKQGVNVAFCDGHVEMKAVLDEELKTLIRAAGHPLP
jgi:prepilin-type processing-associated H-X9-DG protein